MPEHIEDPSLLCAYAWMVKNLDGIQERDSQRSDVCLICDITVSTDGWLCTPKFVTIAQVKSVDTDNTTLQSILDGKQGNPKGRFVLIVLNNGQSITYNSGSYSDLLEHRQVRMLAKGVFFCASI